MVLEHFRRLVSYPEAVLARAQLWISNADHRNPAVIAIKKPRYGHTITTAGGLSPGTASLLCAAFAKSIELSFVAVFVAFLGQLLTTRAMANRKKGITIAEMGMRTWVLQPGTMISRWESVRYAAATFLGVFALVTALMAMVYTTASDALVAPKLKFGNTEHRVLYGQIATSFANTTYLMEKCNTPIPAANDPENYGQTCIQIQNSGEAYHNYMQYLAHWVDDIHIGNGSTNLTERPEPVAVSGQQHMRRVAANPIFRCYTTTLQSKGAGPIFRT